MTTYHYKVIPAPTRGLRGKGVKGAEGKFAHALEQVMNEMGTAGWEYQRAETLPCEERSGLTSKTTTFRNVLVFRRPSGTDIEAFAPKLLDAPEREAEPDGIELENPEAEDYEADEKAERNLNDPLKMRADQLARTSE